MAWPNIYDRRKRVQEVLNVHGFWPRGVLTQLAREFDCSYSAILADTRMIQWKKIAIRPHTIQSCGPSLKNLIRVRDREVCQYCGLPGWVVEHVIPASKGGPALAYNLVVACALCNHRKLDNVWIPKNLDQITEGDPEWKAMVIAMAAPPITKREAALAALASGAFIPRKRGRPRKSTL